MADQVDLEALAAKMFDAYFRERWLVTGADAPRWTQVEDHVRGQWRAAARAGCVSVASPLLRQLDAQRMQIEQLESEVGATKEDHMRACVTVADMHAAAIGDVLGGPRRGVVEDVVDLRAEVEKLRAIAAIAGAVVSPWPAEWAVGAIATPFDSLREQLLAYNEWKRTH